MFKFFRKPECIDLVSVEITLKRRSFEHDVHDSHCIIKADDDSVIFITGYGGVYLYNPDGSDHHIGTLERTKGGSLYIKRNP